MYIFTNTLTIYFTGFVTNALILLRASTALLDGRIEGLASTEVFTTMQFAVNEPTDTSSVSARAHAVPGT